jgi:hypothetical protein
MKVAVVSEDFHSLIGAAGRARRFLVFEASRGNRPQLERYLELPEHVPSYHELHDDDRTHHPLDGLVLITAEAGVGFAERLARRGTRVVITDEPDPLTSVLRWIEGDLPSLPAKVHPPEQCPSPNERKPTPAK